MKKEKMDSFFKNLKKVYKSNIYKDFFIYFNKTWMGNRYPKSLWNYNDIINSENDNNVNNFHFTNNLCENINRFLNRYLKNGICSNFIFRASILSVIDQFENKTLNENNNNKKSEIISFYIKKEKECKILSMNEIKHLYEIYNDIKFINLNKDYIEVNNGNIEILQFEDEDEADKGINE